MPSFNSQPKAYWALDIPVAQAASFQHPCFAIFLETLWEGEATALNIFAKPDTGKTPGRARLLPSQPRYGSAGASPSQAMNCLGKLIGNMFSAVGRGSCRAFGAKVRREPHCLTLPNIETGWKPVLRGTFLICPRLIGMALLPSMDSLESPTQNPLQ